MGGIRKRTTTAGSVDSISQHVELQTDRNAAFCSVSSLETVRNALFCSMFEFEPVNRPKCYDLQHLQSGKCRQEQKMNGTNDVRRANRPTFRPRTDRSVLPLGAVQVHSDKDG